MENIDNKLRTDYEEAQFRLNELGRKKKSMCIFGAVMIAICASMLILLYFIDSLFYDFRLSLLIVSILIGITIGCLAGIALKFSFETSESRYRRIIFQYEANNMKADADEDIFKNSISLSYKYLDEYYNQTREQAQNGFKITFAVAIWGALLIGVGVVAMFMGSVAPSYITCGAGVVSEFIAAVFFYLYNRTITSMSKYHNKLVLSHNISIALKVADSLPSDDKVKAKNQIISELLKNINSYLVASPNIDKDKNAGKSGA